MKAIVVSLQCQHCSLAIHLFPNTRLTVRLRTACLRRTWRVAQSIAAAVDKNQINLDYQSFEMHMLSNMRSMRDASCEGGNIDQSTFNFRY
jgi:hypothetical protein